MSAPNSYKDSFYSDLDSSVESDLGLPSGLLSNIRTKGERSNADQVSSAGAKSVYQIIPATRDAALKKYGVDAYASPQNAAQVAGLLLKDSLDRNKGNIKQAVGEYIGGTDRANWGKVTQSYIARVTGGKDNISAPTQSATLMPPEAVEAYNSGKLSPDQYAMYDKAIKSGQVAPPQGTNLARPVTHNSPDPSADELPAEVKQRYATDRTSEGDKYRAQVDQAIRDGYYKHSGDLAKPAPRSVGDYVGMGARALGSAMGETVDTANNLINPVNIIANSVNTVSKLATGKDLIQVPSLNDTITKGADALNLTKPESDNEQLASKSLQTAAEFAIPVGGEAKLGRLLVDAGAGALSGLAQEKAKQSGASPLVQSIAGLSVGVSGLLAGHITLDKFGPKVAKVVEEVPAHEVFTPEGNLTEHGQEIATRYKLTPEEMQQAYESGANYTETAFNKHYDDIKAAKEEALAEGVPADHPIIKKADDAIAELDAVRAKAEETGQFPTKQVEDYTTELSNKDATPEQRVADAAKLSPDLTVSQGVATNDATKLGNEHDLRTSGTGEAAQEARSIANTNQNALNEAASKLSDAFETNHLTNDVKGSMIADAVQQLKDTSYHSVKELYTALSKVKNAPQVVSKDIKNTALDIIHDEGVDPTTRRAISQELARYGLIGKVGDVTELGRYPVHIEGEPTIMLPSKPEPLNLANAEKLNQRLNELYKDGTSNPQLKLKSVLHDAVEQTLDNVSKEAGTAGQLAKDARSAYAEHRSKFAAKDIVDRVTAKKAGTQTPVMNADSIVDTVIGSKQQLGNLKKLKVRLLSNAESKPAWRVIQGHTLSNIIAKGSDTEGNLVASKLNKAISDLGTEKLKLILDPKEYNDLMRLKRVANDFASTGKGTQQAVDRSLFGAIFHVARFLTMGIGHGAYQAASFVSTLGGGAIKQYQEAKKALEVLEGMKGYKPEQITPAMHKQAINAVKSLASDELLRSTIKATLANSNQDNE